jgi:hypothetical protein
MADQKDDQIARSLRVSPAEGRTLADRLRQCAEFNADNQCDAEMSRPEWVELCDLLREAAAALVLRPSEDWQRLADAAEMLWTVLANVSGGNWSQQSPEWQEAAARWRDNYFAALPPAPGTEDR